MTEPTEEWRREMMRRSEEASPEWAAAVAAARFERQAITVPRELAAPIGANPELRQLHADAVRLYRELVIAGPNGLSLAGLVGASYLSVKQTEEAANLLRESGVVDEIRRESSGSDFYDIIFRVRA